MAFIVANESWLRGGDADVAIVVKVRAAMAAGARFFVQACFEGPPHLITVGFSFDGRAETGGFIPTSVIAGARDFYQRRWLFVDLNFPPGAWFGDPGRIRRTRGRSWGGGGSALGRRLWGPRRSTGRGPTS